MDVQGKFQQSPKCSVCVVHVRRANSVEESVRRGQRQAEQNKLKLGMQIDDKSFQNLLLESQVGLVPLPNNDSTDLYPPGDTYKGSKQMELRSPYGDD
jgi:hypothetical protein